MRFALSRRHFFGLFPAASLVALLPSAIPALTESDARRLIDEIVSEINAVISSGKTESAIYREFERIFRTRSDTSYIAAYAMGVDARRATDAQKRAFTEAFTTYVSRKYGKRFREFIGGRLEVQSVADAGKYFEVRTLAYLRGEAPFDVTFHVSDRTGEDLFFNLYVEGINMLLTERSEVGAMLNSRRGDIDAMIADLNSAG